MVIAHKVNIHKEYISDAIQSKSLDIFYALPCICGGIKSLSCLSSIYSSVYLSVTAFSLVSKVYIVQDIFFLLNIIQKYVLVKAIQLCCNFMTLWWKFGNKWIKYICKCINCNTLVNQWTRKSTSICIGIWFFKNRLCGTQTCIASWILKKNPFYHG